MNETSTLKLFLQ